MFDNLWIEKYRPQNLDDIVLSESNRLLLTQAINDDSIPNLIFAGKPGIGKTSLAKIIVKDVLKCQYLYINASDENGIDTIRNKVTNFSKTKSMDGGIKVIILDEVDGLTLDAQRALRNTMEEYSAYVRFILTANFQHKVIQALQSRCQNFDLTPTISGFHERLETILQKEQVEYHSIDQIKELTKGLYPDLRKAINHVQKVSVNNRLTIENLYDTDDFVQNIISLIQYNKVFEARKYIIKKEAEFGSDYQLLLNSLFNKIADMKLDNINKRECLLVVSEHLYRSAFVLDQEINFFSCLLNVSKTLG